MKTNIRQVEPSKITVRPNAQRPLNLGWARKLAADFNAELAGVLTVTDEGDGTYTALDGQHRVSAAKLSGYSGLLACRIVSAATDKDKAVAFLALNNQRAVSNVEKFKVRVTAEDPTAVAIDKELRGHGWTMGKGVTCVTELEAIYRRSPATLALTIGTITKAWGVGSSKSMARVIVYAVAKVHDGAQVVDRQHLIESLRDIEPVALIARADAGRDLLGQSPRIAAANIVVGLYNKGKRVGRLAEFTSLA